MEQLTKLNRHICDLARQAGEKIMRFYEEGASITWKADSSPLTAADSASHDFLVKALRDLVPEVPVISEESEESANHVGANCSRFWLVDPLDGTKEFVKRTNEFTVNIALVESRQPILGVVHAPALKLTYSGLRNRGSWRIAGDQSTTAISTRRADPSTLSIVASKGSCWPIS